MKRTSSDESTRERVLNAAEQLFADRGYLGVSVRDITQHANVNLGVIRYHFESKESLFRAVLSRNAVAIQEQRLKALALLGDAPTLEQILRALIEPFFAKNGRYKNFRKLFARTVTDPTPEVRRAHLEVYNRDFSILPKTIAEFCSELTDQDFSWRLMCLFGAMFFIEADSGKIDTIRKSQFDTDPEASVKFVVNFLSAGLRAPAV